MASNWTTEHVLFHKATFHVHANTWYVACVPKGTIYGAFCLGSLDREPVEFISNLMDFIWIEKHFLFHKGTLRVHPKGHYKQILWYIACIPRGKSIWGIMLEILDLDWV